MKKFILIYLLLFSSLLSFGQNLKVITYNIRLDIESDGENNWIHRKDILTSQLRFYAPDIFGIQEARPNQVIDISTALPNYNYVGEERDGDGNGESSNIFFNKKRFILKETKTFWLSETPNEISKGWDAAFNRVCTYTLLQDKKSNANIWVFNTHLDHIDEDAKTKGLALILSKIKTLNKQNYPVILMGDFNSEPDTDRIISLKTNMNDCKDISEEKPFGTIGTFNNFDYNKPVNSLIDYIFISKNNKLTVKKYAVLSDGMELKYPSDHFPVYVLIHIK